MSDLTPQQQAVRDALSAAWDCYLAPLREPGAGERLRAVLRDPAALEGAVVAGDPDRPDPQLRALIDEELAKRGLRACGAPHMSLSANSP